MLTKQTAFDTVYKFYRDGGKPGFERIETQCGNVFCECIYFAPNGGMCAGGVILHACGITRERMSYTDENGDSYDLNEETTFPELIAHFGTELTTRLDPAIYTQDRPATVVNNFLTTFVGRLQDVHDSAANDYPGDMQYLLDKLEEFAKKEGLTCP